MLARQETSCKISENLHFVKMSHFIVYKRRVYESYIYEMIINHYVHDMYVAILHKYHSLGKFMVVNIHGKIHM